MFDSLVRKYEAGGDPGCVSSGSGDLGGVCYGIYQLSSTKGSAYEFADWASHNENPTYAEYGAELAQYDASSQEFQDTWRRIGDEDPDGFEPEFGRPPRGYRRGHRRFRFHHGSHD